ncbi:Myb/SANT-like domain containing protein [Parasponia andersonii]|uniref:Myb/SANT-like domain containing protein n=1 Tax=Parasponia andersonii TaxID=3476 RepID=A0A2P5CWN5_PARAD|nr:Myb/SANT-like domain containing protein [Parasponia andersonii]
MDLIFGVFGQKVMNIYHIDNDVHRIDNNDEAFVWTQRHEEIFIDLMEEEVIKGNRSTTTFSKPSWKYIQELFAQNKRGYSDLQLRNKSNQLKQKQNEFKTLLGETVTGQVSATDEVWDKLMRAIKSAKKFKKKNAPFMRSNVLSLVILQLLALMLILQM